MSETLRTLTVGAHAYDYYDLNAAAAMLGPETARLPVSLKVLLENLLRHEDGVTVTRRDLQALAGWVRHGRSDHDIAFHPARVLMPDSSGVPLLADLAAMRDAIDDPRKVNPLVPVDLVIDHSAVAHHAGTADAYTRNIAIEYADNRERYEFLRWAEQTFAGLRIVPPGTGIVHQVNLEYLARPITTSGRLAYPDTLVGMDSHTPMVNALGILGWGVGGIEAGAAMLGEPVSIVIPEVIGCRLTGAVRAGVTATDVVLAITEALRRIDVVGKIVEFVGAGVARLALPDRATIANMAPEYGANMGFFAIDAETLRYLRLTGRPPADIALVEQYAKVQGLWGAQREARYSATLEIDLGSVEPSVAGPRRPQDRQPLAAAGASFAAAFEVPQARVSHSFDRPLAHGDVVIAAITSCTNTSNPSVMIAAGLLARNARARGLRAKPWVKTSLSPGSRVVADYLRASGLQDALDALGFQVIGFGCMTCAGASGALAPEVAAAIDAKQLAVAAVLSANRNFEGRTHPQVRAAYLASPPLVVAFALAGTVRVDLTTEPIGTDPAGAPVYLRDIWPGDREAADVIASVVTAERFTASYAKVFEGEAHWRALRGQQGERFSWDPASSYLCRPPFADEASGAHIGDIVGARVLVMLGDSVTTDHISPVGRIGSRGPAADHLRAQGVAAEDFGSFLTRRANHEVMVRGTFANPRLRNELVPGVEGGVTRIDRETMSIYDAAMRHRVAGTPLVVIAGRDYGSGSSRDWAAKGVALLGVRAVIAESFERIHRSNLVGMGVLPLEFARGTTRKTLALDGSERFELLFREGLKPRAPVMCGIHRTDGRIDTATLIARVDTPRELAWIEAGGILRYVVSRLSRPEAARGEIGQLGDRRAARDLFRARGAGGDVAALGDEPHRAAGSNAPLIKPRPSG